MRFARVQSLIACAGLLAFVAAGYVVGRARLVEFISLSALIAIALSLVSMVQRSLVERIAGTGLVFWIILASATQQFAWAASCQGVYIAAAWLTPPVAGGALLPSAGHWWSGLACWVATFAGVAATTFSVHSVNRGAGLFMRWFS